MRLLLVVLVACAASGCSGDGDEASDSAGSVELA